MLIMEINHCVTPQTNCADYISACGGTMSLFEKFKKVLFEEDNSSEIVLDEIEKSDDAHGVLVGGKKESKRKHKGKKL